MNPSYSECGFKLHLPETIVYEEYVKMNYKFVYREGNAEKIVFYKAMLTDKLNNVFEDVSSSRPFLSGKRFDASVSFWNTNRKVFVKGSRLKLTFLSDKGEKVDIVFLFEIAEKPKLLDVTKSIMTSNEKEQYVAILTKNASSENEEQSYKQENMKKQSVVDEGVKARSIVGIDKYIDAIRTEKKFLMDEGGRKYKVTNGKLISVVKGIYSYAFELDAELHISDDAPIKIVAGMERSNGTVLMCEDFQIIVMLESNIGNNVSSAVISVEPWKLLESLEEKLEKKISLNPGKVVNDLFKVGPGLATELPIDNIPMGQEQVIRKAMTEPVCVVWGPPGTGKTHTMSQIAINFMKQNKKVLIVSHSNVSVDGVAKRMQQILNEKKESDLYKNGTVLRYGYVRDEELKQNQYINSFYYTVCKNRDLSRKIDTLQAEYDKIKHTNGIRHSRIIEIRQEISKLHSQIKEEEHRYVQKASVVATTISKVVIDKIFEDQVYDVVMFDEVSMAYVLQVLCAATFAKEHLICVGDFRQLAPIAQSKAKEILCEDLFTFLGVNKNGKAFYHPWLVMLNEQRRMYPDISAFINRYVYSNRLKNHPVSYGQENQSIVETELFVSNSMNLIDLAGTFCAACKDDNNSRFNLLSAFLSFAVAAKTEKNVDRISIITPYAAQTRLIRAMMLDYRKKNDTQLKCATVHQFQGSESDVVIFDTVESYPGTQVGFLMGKSSDSIRRLINVAVSRAKGKFITVANRRFWKGAIKGKEHTYCQLLEHIVENGNVIQHVNNRSLEQLVENVSLENGPQFYLKNKDYLYSLCTDINQANKKIVISFPAGELDNIASDKLLECIESAKSRNVEVMVKSGEYALLPEQWKKHTYGTNNANFPLIMIDDKVTWYGAPLADWKFVVGDVVLKTVCPIACRFKGEHTAEMIKSLTNLEFILTDGGTRPLLPKNQLVQGDEEGERGVDRGFSLYVHETKKCPDCKKALIITRGRSGKLIMWCKSCKKPHLISPDEINHYICMNQVRCPVCKSYVSAKLDRMGVYCRCDAGHRIKPEEI